MSYSDSGVERFDAIAVARSVSHPMVVDHTGAHQFSWKGAGLTIAPAGRTATCVVAMTTSDGKLFHRRLQLTTEGAVLLATCLLTLSAARLQAETEGVTAEHRELELLVAELPFDDPEWLPRLRPLLFASGIAPARPSAEEDPLLPWRVDDILYPLVLMTQFCMVTVEEIPPDRGVAGVLIMRSDGTGIGFVYDRDGAPAPGGGDLVKSSSDGTSIVRITPASALLLAAVEEAREYVRKASRALGVDGTQLVDPVEQGLVDLREEVLAGLDAVAGFRRLTELFDPDGGEALGPDTPPAQMNAIAVLAMRTWSVRRGRRSPGPLMDLERVTEAAGLEPERVGDTYALRFSCAHLAFQIRSDVVFGCVKVIGWTVRQFACTEETLERCASVSAAYDTFDGSVREALAKYVLDALTVPWLDEEAALGPLVQLADSTPGEDGERLREVLRHLS